MVDPIRVCMVVNNLDVGGLEKLVLSLLEAIDPQKFELSLACLRGQGKLFDHVRLPKERVLVLDSNRTTNLGFARVDLRALARLRAFFRERQVDVVHAHNFGPLIYGGLAARSLPARPRVLYSEHNQVNSASKRDLWKFGYYVRLADQVVAVSGNLKRILEQKLHVRRPVRVILNGIDAGRFVAANGAPVRAELGIADDEFVIGTAVVLSKQKGITHLLRAAPKVLAKLPRARFLIAGDGPLRNELEREAEALGLSGRLSFLGYRSDIPALLASFDMYVLPSLWEGLPLALIEALALGKPIVCTNVGGNGEVVVEGENGFLVAPADEDALADRIIRVGSDQAFRHAAKLGGPKRFGEHFSLATMAASYEALFTEMARKRRSGSDRRDERSAVAS